MRYIDINCDVGEGINNENELMPYISSCSIACGGHAGSKRTVRKVVDLAMKHDVKVGAHPSFPDKANFGRIPLEIPAKELQDSIEDQILLVKEVIEEAGKKLHHVKPHGALYNIAAVNYNHAKIIVSAVRNIAKDAYLYVPYKSVIKEVADKLGIKTMVEAFADRNYNNDLTLVSRKLPNAVITNKEVLVGHLLKMIIDKEVKVLDGLSVKIDAQTFCFHGDNPKAIVLLKYASKELLKRGVKLV